MICLYLCQQAVDQWVTTHTVYTNVMVRTGCGMPVLPLITFCSLLFVGIDRMQNVLKCVWTTEPAETIRLALNKAMCSVTLRST